MSNSWFDRPFKVGASNFAISVAFDEDGDLQSIVGLTLKTLPALELAKIDRAALFVGSQIMRAQLMGNSAKSVEALIPAEAEEFAIERAVLKEILAAQLLSIMGISGQDGARRVSVAPDTRH